MANLAKRIKPYLTHTFFLAYRESGQATFNCPFYTFYIFGLDWFALIPLFVQQYEFLSWQFDHLSVLRASCWIAELSLRCCWTCCFSKFVGLSFGFHLFGSSYELAIFFIVFKVSIFYNYWSSFIVVFFGAIEVCSETIVEFLYPLRSALGFFKHFCDACRQLINSSGSNALLLS